MTHSYHYMKTLNKAGKTHDDTGKGPGDAKHQHNVFSCLHVELIANSTIRKCMGFTLKC